MNWTWPFTGRLTLFTVFLAFCSYIGGTATLHKVSGQFSRDSAEADYGQVQGDNMKKIALTSVSTPHPSLGVHAAVGAIQSRTGASFEDGMAPVCITAKPTPQHFKRDH